MVKRRRLGFVSNPLNRGVLDHPSKGSHDLGASANRAITNKLESLEGGSYDLGAHKPCTN